MHQVADWLDKLGLGQYAERFAENDISFSILPDLTDQHLEKIGVASLGHRLQLLRADQPGEGSSQARRSYYRRDCFPDGHAVCGSHC